MFVLYSMFFFRQTFRAAKQQSLQAWAAGGDHVSWQLKKNTHRLQTPLDSKINVCITKTFFSQNECYLFSGFNMF